MDPKLRILIVDDDRRMTRTLADILTVSGYEVQEAASGPQALEKVSCQRFDCVLTDIKMPAMNGVELHRQMRQAQPGLPVVLMTAYAADELIHQGLQDGVVGVFDKPLDINHLLGFFNSLAKSRSIVVVDDDLEFCQTLGDILSPSGFRVAQAHAAGPDLRAISDDAQVILLDIKLNGVNGVEVLKDIRKRQPNLPVLMVTGYRQEMAASIQAALEFDALACLYKPLEIPQLLQILSKLQLERLRAALKSNRP